MNQGQGDERGWTDLRYDADNVLPRTQVELARDHKHKRNVHAFVAHGSG